jgi:hypothetical protein
MAKEERTLASRFNELMSLQYHRASPPEQFPDASKRAAEIGFPGSERSRFDDLEFLTDSLHSFVMGGDGTPKFSGPESLVDAARKGGLFPLHLPPTYDDYRTSAATDLTSAFETPEIAVRQRRLQTLTQEIHDKEALLRSLSRPDTQTQSDASQSESKSSSQKVRRLRLNPETADRLNASMKNRYQPPRAQKVAPARTPSSGSAQQRQTEAAPRAAQTFSTPKKTDPAPDPKPGPFVFTSPPKPEAPPAQPAQPAQPPAAKFGAPPAPSGFTGFGPPGKERGVASGPMRFAPARSLVPDEGEEAKAAPAPKPFGGSGTKDPGSAAPLSFATKTPTTAGAAPLSGAGAATKPPFGGAAPSFPAPAAAKPANFGFQLPAPTGVAGAAGSPATKPGAFAAFVAGSAAPKPAGLVGSAGSQTLGEKIGPTGMANLADGVSPGAAAAGAGAGDAAAPP